MGYCETTIEAAPVAAWLTLWQRDTGTATNTLARRLADRTGRSFDAWHRWLCRIKHAERVDDRMVEEMMLVLGRHLSEVDSSYHLATA